MEKNRYHKFTVDRRCLFLGMWKKNVTDSYEQVLSNNIQNGETAENIEEHVQDDKETFPLEKDIENNKDNAEYLEQAADEQKIVMRPKVKGIFVTGPMAGTSNMEKLIGLVEETELNAIVMDLKMMRAESLMICRFQ